jgi:hypothetical protein
LYTENKEVILTVDFTIRAWIIYIQILHGETLSQPWPVTEIFDNVDDSLEYFLNQYNNSLKSHAPIKQKW